MSGSKSNLAYFHVGDHARIVSLALRPLEFHYLKVFLKCRQQRLRLSAQCDPTQPSETLLLKALAVEVFVLGDENALGLHGCRRHDGIWRVGGNVKALPVHAMTPSLKVSTERIRYIVVKKKRQLNG